MPPRAPARVRCRSTRWRAALRPSATTRYTFAWRSTAFDGRLGACHCVELPFVFHRTDLPALYGARALLGPGLADRGIADLAARTHAAWVAFATHGDPGWQPYDTDQQATMHLDHTWHRHHGTPAGSATTGGPHDLVPHQRTFEPW
ncbi:hypothetical protein [Streptomyces sioyaensis]|uniref:hypothetical protein n=1 Tax=Streptomyces sioyaensis TaxID=67364 RepID=UPI003F54072C